MNQLPHKPRRWLLLGLVFAVGSIARASDDELTLKARHVVQRKCLINVAVPIEGTDSIAVGEEDQIRVWSCKDWSAKATLRTHTDAVMSLAAASDDLIFSGGLDGLLVAWNGRAERVVWFHRFAEPIMSISTDHKGEMIAVASGTKVYMMKSGNIVSTITFSDNVTSLVLTASSKLIVCVPVAVAGKYVKSEIRIIDHPDKSVDATVLKVDKLLTSLANCEESASIIIGSRDGYVGAVHVKTHEVWALKCHKDRVNRVSVMSGLPYVLSASDDKTAAILDMQKRRVIARISDHKDAVTSANYLPKSKEIVSTDVSGEIHVYDFEKALKK